MRENKVKRVMREGHLAIGTYVALADSQIVEIIGLAGFDAAFIDMEHTGFDLSLVVEMIRAADTVGVTSMVRVPDNDATLILRLLDMGAEGIVIPHVDGVEGARRAVAAVRYPPLGERGAAAGTRAARFGSVPWADHVRQSNEEIVLSLMTEDERGVDEIAEIAALDGVDLVAIGPSDLSQMLGTDGPGDPRLAAKVDEIAETVKQVGKARLAFPINHPAFPLSPPDLEKLGVAYANVAPPPPSILLQAMRRSVEDIHRVTGRDR